MIKRLIIVFFVLISTVSVAQQLNSEHQLLWEISGNGLKTKSYLFGSFHTNDRRVFNFSDSTYIALNNAKAIVLETDITDLFVTLDTRRDDLNMLYDESGNPYTATNKASKTVYGDESGMPQFLDAYFQQYCLISGKQFHALESIEDQMRLLEGKIDNQYSYTDFESRILSQEKILKLYLNGDINGLDKLMKTSLVVYPGLYDELILNRNVSMANGIDTLILKQSTFIAVGAGHLAGDKGIINLLRAQGYKVRKVGYSRRESTFMEKSEVLKHSKYFYSDERIGLNAVFSGKPLVYEDNGEAWKVIYREFGQGNTYSIEVVEKGNGTLESFATDYIQSPRAAKKTFGMLDYGVAYAEGISDTYPEGLSWIRIIEGETHMVIIKTYGGNKFMNSKRPQNFFNKVWLD